MTTKGDIVRSKARWYEQGERYSKYFFALEKTRHSKKTMKAIMLQDGAISRDQKRFWRNNLNTIKSCTQVSQNISSHM